jgi:hypothetical protein
MTSVTSVCRHCVAVLLTWCMLCQWAPGQAIIRRMRPVPGQPGMINLPYIVSDTQGNQWMVYQQGMLQMQGNAPVYSQGAMLTINGGQPGAQTNMGRIDDKTGELILENMNANGFTLTRRLEFNTDEGYVRYIDIIKNPQAQDQQLNLQLNSNVNFGVQSATMVPDPKKKDQNLAWVAQIAGPGKAAIELYAGKGAKVVPVISWQQGNNSVVATLNMTVPGNKEIAIVHFHGIAANQDQGVQWVNSIKEEKLLADVPKEIRKIIVNFPVASSLIGDLEILRGDALDVVELHDGDRYNGNLSEASYPLQTFYGKIDLPADSVVSIVNVGEFRPRQLIVTADGQIFGGNLIKPTIDLVLSSGQKTQIPLSQISRLGYRHRAGETEDASSSQLQPPYVLMSGGDRIGVAMPTSPIDVVTRYGSLQLAPQIISSIAFSSADSSVHVIDLVDGSRFSGLITAPELELKLTAGGQTVKLPTGALSRLVVTNPSDDKDDSVPDLKLKGDDHLAGSLQGTLQLDTAFDTMKLNAAEIRELGHAKESRVDLSVTTWDGTIFSGQLQDQEVLCHLITGVDVHVPIDLVMSYTNPSAQPSALMLDRIKAIVADLNADDWKQRDAAEDQLVKIGTGVVPTLKGMRDQQPPEAQQRIDSVLKKLGKPGAAVAGH